jgi:hypothetical protein
MASYDELYAEIVGDRDVLYDATAEAHHRIAGLLTSDSPPEDGALHDARRRCGLIASG